MKTYKKQIDLTLSWAKVIQVIKNKFTLEEFSSSIGPNFCSIKNCCLFLGS